MARRRLALGDIIRKAMADAESTNWRRVLMSEPCVYCGAKPQGLDHIVAKSCGGVDAFTVNRAPACTACDGRKGNTPMLVFLVMRKGLRIMPRASQVEPSRLRRQAEREARREMRRQYREANEIAFRNSGTFGDRLLRAITRSDSEA